jgi:hypothetical protein
MKIVIFTLIPIIIITFAYNRGLLPKVVYFILFIIIGVIGAMNFWKTYASIMSRDNMNYESYNWSFNPSTAPTATNDDSDPWGKIGNVGICVGEACCSEGQVYDDSKNICIIKTTENFDVLEKMQPGKYKADVDLRTNLKPYNF